MEADRLQELLRKCLSDGRKEDWEALRAEAEKAEQAELRAELYRLGSLTREDLVADEEKMWKEISLCRGKEQKRRWISRKWGRYAAVIALPLLVGSLFFWMQHLKQELPPQPESWATLSPGHRQAVLKLGNGEQIRLEEIGQDTVLMREGMTIRLDSSRSIFYQNTGMTERENDYHTIVVPRGGEYRLILADGSVVWLNSDSELSFPAHFSGGQRKVVLKGEGYFEVAKNPSLPFVVEVGDMEVKVLGTRFNINAYREDGVFQTTLVRGKVEVSSRKAGERVVLLPDQQARSKDGQLSVCPVDASVYTAWIEGKFYFESESLLEIAAQLERWYDVEFFFSREELKNYEFTGVIRRDYTANQILDIIAKTTQVRFDVKGRTVRVY